ncbi:hypothetical protein SISSUDRAFT_1042380 [Sistotremastrum suecicum HHB10207 ss-3]|uniref:F-box domain-containing protein n=1 Tax=Sistotremastrum suecicum HHB10207 ss-3 TaxID=1314776 RepID=A0A166GN71_9AGAM|nr:hypothetical protein SISSUDRAFT_1042380 [Sistotremastrum suecicum HHB10207 ss-3]
MQRFWTINELVSGTFAFLEQGDLFRCALVSKCLSELALDSLYREIDRLFNILSILSPISPPTYASHYNGFPRNPIVTFDKQSFSEDDWVRFQKYARRVRKLDCNWAQNEYNIPPLSGPDPRSFNIPYFALFPHLKILRWTGRHSMVFQDMHVALPASLKELTLQAPSSIILDQLHRVLQRCLKLESVTLLLDYLEVCMLEDEYDYNLPSIDDNKLSMLMTFMPYVKELHLTPLLVAAETLKSISRLPSLTSLKVVPWSSLPRKFPLTPPSLSPPSEGSTFPALRELCLRLPRDSPSIPECYTACPITSLWLDADQDSAEDFPTLLPEIAQFRHLRYLVIMLLTHHTPIIVPNEGPSHFQSDSEQYLTFDMLRPLLSLSLVTFEVFVDRLALLEHEIEEMAYSWPSLEALSLCIPDVPFPESSVPHKSMPISSLEVFGRHCHNLKQLRIYVDATVVPPRSDNVAERHVFDCLQQLDLWGSKVNKPRDVALYLAEILPRDCELVRSEGWTYECEELFGLTGYTVSDVWDDIGLLFAGMQSLKSEVFDRLSQISPCEERNLEPIDDVFRLQSTAKKSVMAIEHLLNPFPKAEGPL